MTHPPSGPDGRPGQSGPPPAAPPHEGGAQDGSPGQPPPALPKPAFDPWGRPPGAFDSYGSLEGPVNGQRRRKRTGLIIGVTAAVVVLAGAGTAAVLLTSAGSGDSTATAANEGGPAAPTTPAKLAQLAIDSFNDRSASQYATLMCAAPSQAEISSAQQQWATASGLHGSVTGSPDVTGATASVTVTVTYNGNTQRKTIPMRQQGQKWCIDES